MRTRLSIFCDKVIEAGWLVAIVVVPLFFNIYSQRVFEPDKLSLLRSLALVMSAAWLVRVVEDWRSGAGATDGRTAEAPGDPSGARSFWVRLAHKPMVLPTLLLVLVYLVSTVLSIAPAVSFLGSYQRLQGTYTTLAYIVIFSLVLDGLRTRRQFHRLVTTAIVVSFPIALYGLVQHFGLDPLPWGGNVTNRVAANMGNAIFVAAYLIMVVPLTLTRLLKNWKEVTGTFETRDGMWGLLAFGLLAACLVAAMLVRSSSGGGWLIWVALALGLGSHVGIYLLNPADRRTRLLSISLPLTFAFLVGFSWVQEVIIPPPEGVETPGHLWLGILAAVIFVIAMVAFAYYLRKPVVRLLLLSAYFIVLIAQLVCVFYTQSRGPLLGLLAGLFVFVAVLGLLKRRVWLFWLVFGSYLAIGVFLVVFNTVNTPLIEKLRETRYVGRLGEVLQTEEGTGKVRVLIWEGVVKMISPHSPLQYPGTGGAVDPYNAVRPLIGYGPESMYVAYNRFYPADLAHYEKRNASPDRSHNETFDALAQTGIVGFLVYMLVFASVFYYALKWLGLIRAPWQRWAFLGLWIGGGIVGALASWLWRGPVYLGVGIPGGVILGLGAYLLLIAVKATADRSFRETMGGGDVLWGLALLTAITAHFVEIHFGIAVASTRTYFWVYTALLVVLGTRFAAKPAEAEPAIAEVAAPARATSSRPQAASSRQQPAGSKKRAAGGKQQATKGRQPSAASRRPLADDWWGSIALWTVVAILMLGTMLFDYVTVQQDSTGLLDTIWRSLTQRQGASSPILLALFLCTFAMVALLGFSELATGDESSGKGAAQWLSAAGVYLGASTLAVLIFGLLHASRIRPVTLATLDATNPLPNTISFYYAFVLLIAVATAVVLAFLFRRAVMPWRWIGKAADAVLLAASVVVPVVAIGLLLISNVNIVRADILYKQGLSSEKASEWDGAIFFYQKAIDVAKDQDFYYLFLGRALMEKGRAAAAQDRDSWFVESEQALLTARDIAPLNTDHSANLARLYRTWGGLSQEPRRTELLGKALDYYVDATNLSPQNAQLFNEWGQTYLALGQTDKALEKYEHSLSLDESFAQTYLLLGELYTDGSKWADAATAYQAAVRISATSADAWSSLGYVYSQLGQDDQALAAYQKAVELSPKAFGYRKNLAILYQQLGRTEDALREAEEALTLAPEAQKQEMESYVAQLRAQASTLSPEDAQKVQQLIEQGRTQLDAQDWANAAATFQQALEIDPANVAAHSALAYVYAKQNKPDEAIAENLAVLAVIPDDYSSNKNLALLYQQKGDIDKAIAAAESALAVAPEADKPTLQQFLDLLRPSPSEPTPTPVAAKPRAGDLPPTQRDGMYKNPPAMTIDPTKSYQATIVTVKGDIVVQLAAADAPQTVNNFVFLSQQGFYDGLTFHRVESQPGFSLIQGGDPAGTGRGGPGYTIPAEIGLSHKEGAIAMARLGDTVNPDRASSGSQFYICLGPILQLDGAYTVFGYVVDGLDVAKQIAVGDKILRIDITER
jgi:cyclophilin family peptidyl-prolyl cis-trans isomerase/tetratricopeptide (TPR) repeat protein